MRSLFLFTLLTISIITVAQTTERDVISSNGNFYSNSAGQLSTTLGEPIISTVSSTSNVLTQGFQQNNIIVESIEDYQKDLQINVFPNPVSKFITIKVQNLNNELTFRLVSVEGKIIINKNIKNLETTINVEDFAKGNYFLSITENNKIIKTYKIIKQ